MLPSKARRSTRGNLWIVDIPFADLPHLAAEGMGLVVQSWLAPNGLKFQRRMARLHRGLQKGMLG